LLVSATLIELPLCASFENVCSITRKLWHFFRPGTCHQ
jgi:hypothetical protein